MCGSKCCGDLQYLRSVPQFVACSQTAENRAKYKHLKERKCLKKDICTECDEKEKLAQSLLIGNGKTWTYHMFMCIIRSKISKLSFGAEVCMQHMCLFWCARSIQETGEISLLLLRIVVGGNVLQFFSSERECLGHSQVRKYALAYTCTIAVLCCGLLILIEPGKNLISLIDWLPSAACVIGSIVIGTFDLDQAPL